MRCWWGRSWTLLAGTLLLAAGCAGGQGSGRDDFGDPTAATIPAIAAKSRRWLAL